VVTEQKVQQHEVWPSLRVADWTATRDTLHMWTQIVGKIRLAQAPLLNHWWQVTMYVSPRGLTTSAIPYGSAAFDLEFDFVDHQLRIRCSGGETRSVALEAKPVADFYAETIGALGDVRIEAKIQARPNEVDPAIPFAEDYEHASYDPGAAHLFWRQLVQADRVRGDFRSHFVAKVSPGPWHPRRAQPVPAALRGRTHRGRPRPGTGRVPAHQTAGAGCRQRGRVCAHGAADQDTVVGRRP
jgi:hypothetical protein